MDGSVKPEWLLWIGAYQLSSITAAGEAIPIKDGCAKLSARVVVTECSLLPSGRSCRVFVSNSARCWNRSVRNGRAPFPDFVAVLRCGLAVADAYFDLYSKVTICSGLYLWIAMTKLSPPWILSFHLVQTRPVTSDPAVLSAGIKSRNREPSKAAESGHVKGTITIT